MLKETKDGRNVGGGEGGSERGVEEFTYLLVGFR